MSTITGLAYLNGKIYIVTSDSNRIAVFLLTTPFVRQQRETDIIVNGLIGPKDIVTCSACCCVADSKGVWKVIDEKGCSNSDYKPWLINNQVISLSAIENRILLTEHTKLHMYELSGKHLFEIQLLDENFTNAQHALEMADHKTIIVCQFHAKNLQRLTKIDFSGKAQQDHTNTRVEDVVQFVPRYAAYDDSSGALFVIDQLNSRVLGFNEHLLPCGIVVKEDDNTFSRVCYIPKHRLLLVANWYRQIKVYRISLPR